MSSERGFRCIGKESFDGFTFMKNSSHPLLPNYFIFPVFLSLFLCFRLVHANEPPSVPSENGSQAIRPGQHGKLNSDYMVFARDAGKSPQRDILVDVRSPKSFDSIRIPGSINIPLHAIRTKDFLKSKSIVLLNEGYLHGMLEDRCKELNALGFNAKYLYGGLQAWRSAGMELEGDIHSRDMNRMPASIFHIEKDFPDWFFVTMADSAGFPSELAGLQGRLIRIDSTTNRESATTTVGARIRSSRFFSVVLLDDPEDGYREIEHYLRNVETGGIFGGVWRLEGGLPKYTKYLFVARATGTSRAKGRKNEERDRCSRCD
jgi:rhodanese-related sulfurtransferase